MNRKKLTLPSGAKVVIRPMCGFDFVQSGSKQIPLLFEIEKERKTGKQRTELSEQEIEFHALTARIALTRCCSPITKPDGTRWKIVDKELDELADGELCIGEISDADAAMIITEVGNLSQMTKEAAEKAKPFPVEPSLDVPASPAG